MANTSNTGNTRNEKLSALMDGELTRDDALAVIKALGQNDSQRGDWDCYHLIGDALRGQVMQDSTPQAIPQVTADARPVARTKEPHVNASVTTQVAAPIDSTLTRCRVSTEAIFAQLAAEPTVFAPAAARNLAQQVRRAKPSAVHQKTRFALAMAASVVTVSAIGVIAFKQQQGSVASAVVAQQTPAKQAQALADGSASEIRVNDYLLVHRQFANPGALQAAALKRTERTERTERMNQQPLPVNQQPRIEQPRIEQREAVNQ